MEPPDAAAVVVTLITTLALSVLFWATWNRKRFARWYGFIAEAQHSNTPWYRPTAAPMLDPNGYETSLETSRRFILVIDGCMLLILGGVITSWVVHLASEL